MVPLFIETPLNRRVIFIDPEKAAADPEICDAFKKALSATLDGLPAVDCDMTWIEKHGWVQLRLSKQDDTNTLIALNQTVRKLENHTDRPAQQGPAMIVDCCLDDIFSVSYDTNNTLPELFAPNAANDRYFLHSAQLGKYESAFFIRLMNYMTRTQDGQETLFTVQCNLDGLWDSTARSNRHTLDDDTLTHMAEQARTFIEPHLPQRSRGRFPRTWEVAQPA